jgi:pyrroline-5-carboxylate reductase
MAQEYALGVIGGGNMGAAIIRGAISSRVLDPAELIVAEIDPAKRTALQRFGCATTGDAKAAARARQVLLAVKPQMFPEVARQIAPLPRNTIVISIMAGLRSRRIGAALGGHARIIRVMPNVPCQIGAGMTAIAPGEGAQIGDDSLARSLFNALGKTILVDESMMYAVTAVSGSGPAYVFALAEAMEAAATQLGFDASTAKLLVEQTVMGAGKLLSESGLAAAELRATVTSPGGTTAAALDVMYKRHFQQMMIDALTAARDRGIELDRMH